MSESPLTPASPTSPTSPSKVPTTSNNLNPKKFEGDGFVVKGKLIGADDLSIDRDEKICLDSMFKLKALARARGEHKQKIQINLTMTAVKIIDDNTKAHIASHEIERISFVVTDPRDSRAFGYIYNTTDDRHQFWAIKTERAAAATVLALKELFEIAFEQFTNVEKAKLEANKSTTPLPSPPVSAPPVNQVVSTQEPSPTIVNSPLPPAPPSVVPTQEPSTNILDSPLPPPAPAPVVPTATPLILDDNPWGESYTTTIPQTTGPVTDNLLDMGAPPQPVLQPAKIIDPLEDLFNGFSTTTTTQPPASTNTNDFLLGFTSNSPPTNPYANFSPQTANFHPVNTTLIFPQQQQPFTTRVAPPPPPPPQQQDLLVPRSLSPVAPPSVTNPFSGFDILGDLSSGTTTKPTKDSFFPAPPPPKTIQQLQMEKQP